MQEFLKMYEKISELSGSEQDFNEKISGFLTALSGKIVGERTTLGDKFKALCDPLFKDVVANTQSQDQVQDEFFKVYKEKEIALGQAIQALDSEDDVEALGQAIQALDSEDDVEALGQAIQGLNQPLRAFAQEHKVCSKALDVLLEEKKEALTVDQIQKVLEEVRQEEERSELELLATLLQHSENSVFFKEIFLPLIKVAALASGVAVVGTAAVFIIIQAWPALMVAAAWLAMALAPLLLILPYVGIALAGIVGATLLAMVIKGAPWNAILKSIQDIPYMLKRAAYKLHAAWPMAKEYRVELSEQENKTDFSHEEDTQLNQVKDAVLRREHKSEVRLKHDKAIQDIDALTQRITKLEGKRDHLKLANSEVNMETSNGSRAKFFKSPQLRDSTIKQIEAKINTLTQNKEKLEANVGKYKDRITQLATFSNNFRAAIFNALKESKLDQQKGSLVFTSMRSNISPKVCFVSEKGKVTPLNSVSEMIKNLSPVKVFVNNEESATPAATSSPS